MQSFYFKHISNFGDELNTWLWDRLIPGMLDDDDSTLFIGIGTYLTSEWVPPGRRVVVFSAGAGYGPIPEINDSWSIYCVRGPLTAKVLGLDPAAAVTDAAALVQRTYLPREAKCHKVSYIPHHFSAKEGSQLWRSICQDLGVNYIDPHLPVDEILATIQQSELLITEALHGAIVADTLRVPWVPVTSGQHILDFKWRDWCGSMGLQYQPQELLESANVPARTPEHTLEYSGDEEQLITEHINKIIQSADPCLSDDKLLEQRLIELEERLEQFKSDYAENGSKRTQGPARFANSVIQEARRRKQVIAQRKSDIERWSDSNQLEAFWLQRAEVAATMIPAGATILDLGCGSMAIEKLLPANCKYIPCDLVARDERTLVCNFNDGEMPEKNGATILIMLEVLEYIYDVPAFLGKLHQYDLPIIMSYIPTDSDAYTNRADHGWVSGMSLDELSQALQQAGFNLLEAKRPDSNQVLFHLKPAVATY